MGINPVYCGLSVIFSTLIGSLLLLVNTHGSFRCKQGMLLESSSYYTVNKVAYGKHHFTTSCGI